MHKKECVAMLLAGGQGSRLGLLTRTLAKPAVPFGGKYRIIDFPLSNCNNSGIDAVGVLTQYKPLALNSYIGIGSPWDLDRRDGGVFVLPPYVRERGGEWYKGTADAIFQNMNFIDLFNPRYVLVLSGDHIYKMDYSLMIGYHRQKESDATIAVIPVPWEEASRFGIMSADDDGRITEFAEKPQNPKSNLASMGIYIFNWPVLRRYLLLDGGNSSSSHDFGKDIIPRMLADKEKMYAYPFTGYWKDVGTVESYWKANMDLLAEQPPLDIFDTGWRIYSVNPTRPPHYLGPDAQVEDSIISEGCTILGEVRHSVIFPEVSIAAGAVVRDSIIMPQARIEAGCVVDKAIIDHGAVIGERAVVRGQHIIVVGEQAVVAPGSTVSRDIGPGRTAEAEKEN
jgi:glucose-1-phosphate adenylyltransferase